MPVMCEHFVSKLRGGYIAWVVVSARTYCCVSECLWVDMGLGTRG